MKTDQELMDEHIATTRYDKTPDWRRDSRTNEDPDDEPDDAEPVKPVLTRPPGILERR